MTDVKQVKKVWGYEIWMANTELYCGKKLILEKGKISSIHYHKKKDETFYILKGRVLMEVGDEKKVMREGEAVRILPGIKHRFVGLEDSTMIEISTHHEEDDSYRDTQSGDAPKEIMEEYG